VQPSSGILYLVATPIGNLEDITLRAVRLLREVDFVICEDSRHSGILLKHLEIKKPLRVFHDHTQKVKLDSLIQELQNGSQAAYVTDAGTPLVSDPGFALVQAALNAGVRIESIPGPTAFVAALIVSGLPTHVFTFVGYLPQKEKAKRDALQNLEGEQRTLIFYESPYRVLKTLKAMLDIFGDRRASVSRELTKKFEETVRGRLSEILAYFEKKKILGEWAIVVSGKED